LVNIYFIFYKHKEWDKRRDKSQKEISERWKDLGILLNINANIIQEYSKAIKSAHELRGKEVGNNEK
jgi:hypothetical protein